MRAVLLQADDGRDPLPIRLEDWRRIVFLAQWSGWGAPLDHWEFALDREGAATLADRLEETLQNLGEPPRGGSEVAAQILPPLNLDALDAFVLDAIEGLALFEIRSHLRDFFVLEFDALRGLCDRVIRVARSGGVRVSFDS